LIAGIIGNKDLALAKTTRIADSKADGNASVTLGHMAAKTALELKQRREAGDKGRQETDLKKAEIELKTKQEERKTKQVELETKKVDLEILQAQIRLEMEKKKK